MGASLNAMLTCKEVSRTIASDEVTTADWRQRMAVKLHLLMCRHCRRYTRQMRALGDAARHIFAEEPTDASSRERLRSSILDQISSGEEDDPNSTVR